MAFEYIHTENYVQAKECDICEQTGHISEDCPFRGKCFRCGQAGHRYRDCRHEPVAATSGPPELAVQTTRLARLWIPIPW